MNNQQRRLQTLQDHFTVPFHDDLQVQCHSSTTDGKGLNHEQLSLKQERDKATFCPRDLTYLLDGGKENTLVIIGAMLQKQLSIFCSLLTLGTGGFPISSNLHHQIKEKIYEEISREPLFKTDGNNVIMLPHHSLDQFKKIFELGFWKRDQSQRDNVAKLLAALDLSTATKVGAHAGLFIGSITGNGSDANLNKYEYNARRGKILGCFAMTELGHGSNATGLETTATYDKNTREFVINTPTITATKWWIGNAAETATHTICFARLLVDGKDYGVHSFVVQIRNLVDHKPMPGITLGDCGAKLGVNGVDNGWIQFHNVRIPKEDMLSKYASVSDDGTYSRASKTALALQRVALIGARVGIAIGSAFDGMIALTVAIRYSAVRRQFGNALEGEEASQENQILDYQTHMYRLLPPLAQVFAIHFAASGLNTKYKNLLQELDKKDFSNLNDTHAIAAGMKAFCSWTVRDAIIICRDCLGGHGISSYSRIARLIKDFQVQTTWDGDNTVLSQQTARHLLGSFAKATSGSANALPGLVKYLASFQEILSEKFAATTADDLLKSENQIKAFQWRATHSCARIAQEMQQKVMDGKTELQAWNDSLVDLVALARAHCELYWLVEFVNVLESQKQKPALYNVLKRVCDLYALYTMEKNIGVFRDDDYVSSSQATMIKQKVRDLCLVVRSQAIPLVDSFNLPEFIIDTPLGAQDGNVYEKYFERVNKKSSKDSVPRFYKELLFPLTHQK